MDQLDQLITDTHISKFPDLIKLLQRFHELEGADTDTFIKVWRTFEVEKKPSKWIVWPYSESKGWLDKIEGKL